METLYNIVRLLTVFFLNFDLYIMLIVYMFCVPRMLHAMQLEGYNYKDYIRWLPKNLKNAFWPGLKQLLACGGLYIAISIINFIAIRIDYSLITSSVFKKSNEKNTYFVLILPLYPLRSFLKSSGLLEELITIAPSSLSPLVTSTDSIRLSSTTTTKSGV